jgi:hypothetical protein
LGSWAVCYLTAQTDAWAPNREVLVVPRSLAGLDEERREIGVELTGEQLRNSPSLTAGSPVTREFQENFYGYYGWRERWRAEIDAESVSEPPTPTAPPAEEPLPAEANVDAPGLARYDQLLAWLGETADQSPVRLRELLLDDRDWTVPYLELLMENVPIRERCLVRPMLVAAADPVAQRFYLAVTADDLRKAPLKPYPAPDEKGCEVRTLNGSTA